MDDVVSRQTVKRQMIKYGFHAPDMTVTEFVEDLSSVNSQKSKTEPRYCDRNICLRNEYNSIGCNECEVTKSQESNTVIGTGDGAYYRIKALQAQADGEYISRQAVQNYIAHFLSLYLQDNVREAVEAIDEVIGDMPSVAIPSAEPKTGHWIEHPEIETSAPEYLMFCECSECGDKQCFCKPDIHRKHFCNNCGAKMVEPQERSEK